MNPKVRLLLLGALVLVFAAVGFFSPQAAQIASSKTPANKVLARALAVSLGQVKLKKGEQLVSAESLYAVLQSSGELDRRASASKAKSPKLPSTSNTQGCQNVFTNGSLTNIRVNQDCSLRRQAEEVVVVNPTNPANIIAGQNDSRIGFNHCGYDFSFDTGATWGDQLPPFYQFVLGDGHTADACSDPTGAFDTKGNAYVGGILFDINSAASAFVVAKSNAGIGGAFYHSPQPGPFQTSSDTPLGVIASDNDPNVFNDKEFIYADTTSYSPKHDNLYGVWTRFNASTGAGLGFDSPIYFSQSTDGGATWSKGIEISGANAALCSIFSGEGNANACDQNQGADIVAEDNGLLLVSFNNGNTSTPGVQQQLVVTCDHTKDCSKKTNWKGPYKIADDFATQPFGPNAATACSGGGYQCLPPNGYRQNDYGSITTDKVEADYFVWADFRNGGGSCGTGSAATSTPPCNNDVFYAYTGDHGVTWSAPHLVTPATKFGQTAQWQPWSIFDLKVPALLITFYDRSYGNCETDGCNDITLASVTTAASNNPKYAYGRVTTSSMPNLLPSNNPVQAGFLGDYMWISTDCTFGNLGSCSGKPAIVWADTRGLNGNVEGDIYFSSPPIPVPGS